jgi:1-acyl-sn-glycerol-3-phosphate acyltransferase
VKGARLALGLLWISQTARALADNCLRMFVVLEVARQGQLASNAAWHQVTPFVIIPFILLAPVNGAVSNSLPRRGVLAAAAGFSFVVAAASGSFLGMQGNPWLWCLAMGLHALAAAVYSPTRYALLPAAAQDGRIPLGRVVGWIEMGGAGGIVAGLVLGWALHGRSWAALAEAGEAGGFPVAVAVTAALNVLAVVTALPVQFPSDVLRPESPMAATAGFFRDCRRIVHDPEPRNSLLAMAAFFGLLTGGTGALIGYALGPQFAGRPDLVLRALVLVSIGAAAGSFLASLQGHPHRSLGLVPYAATGLLAAFVWLAASLNLTWPPFLLGLTGAVINVPLRAAYQAAVPVDARGNAMAVMNMANYLAGTALAVLLLILSRLELLLPVGQIWFLAGLACVGVFVAWWALLRDGLELLVEILIWPLYRIRAQGPGARGFPPQGPVLIIANHTAWLDPVWLAKVIPRRLTPLMTSKFYDLPILRLLMLRVVHAIRVPAAPFRRQAPELDEAIRVLDGGNCVMLFPEGHVKRRGEQALRQFGQGVWRILSQRPQTPVVVCWIEGGWGSFTSWAGGPPLRGKPIDCWRSIDIALDEPRLAPAHILADQRATRHYFMDACLATRAYLGLEPLTREEHEDEEPALETEA